MGDFFDGLEAQLREAARARVAQRGRSHGLWRPRLQRRGGGRWLGRGSWGGPWLGRGLRGGLRAAPVLLAAAVTIVVAVGALVLLHHAQGPAPAPPAASSQVRALDAQLHRVLGSQVPPHMAQELVYIQDASRRAWRSERACRVGRPPPPYFVAGSPGRPLLSALGVLRRPASAGEQVNIEQLGVSAGGYYSRYARQVQLGPSSSAYILAQRTDPAAGQPGPGCSAANAAALRRMLTTIPAALRAPTLALQARMLAYGQRLVDGPRHDAVCFALMVRNSSTGESCGLTVSAIRQGEAFQSGDSMSGGLVPDGVASVTLRYSAAAGRPARTFTGRVHSNVYAIRVGARYENALHGSVWRSRTGRVLRSVPLPPPDAGQRFCRAHEIRCISLLAVISEPSSSSGGSRNASESATTASGTSSGTTSPSR
ncbi:MAG: hypothetical protein ACRDMJ_14885 [Solirubrobacteraceae bacterium]